MKSKSRLVRVAAVAAALALAATGLMASAQMFGGGYGGMMGGYGGGYGPGMMGGYGGGYGPGMMGFGYANRPVAPGWGGGVLAYPQVQDYLRDSDGQGRVDVRANTVSYTGADVTIDMVAVQPGHEDQTFEVAGLTNPTLVVPRGATVHLNLVNMDYGDNMEHGLLLTQAPPPYPYMAMMATGPGLAQIEPLLPWRSERDIVQAHYAVLSTTFVARDPGTYWYVCPTPEHAERGMFGKFVVR